MAPSRREVWGQLNEQSGSASGAEGWPEDLGFGVRVVSLDGPVVVSVRGEIDIASAPVLWERLAEAIPTAQERLVVDLTDTTFMDSMGLSVLVRAFKRLRHGGADLVLRSPNGSVRRVLNITRLDTVITIED
jgi:anti-sigma B factor antagonist